MAVTKQDFLIDSSGNYAVASGDLIIGDCLYQEALSIVRSNKGEYKHYPLVGCNLVHMQNSQNTKGDIERIIKQQLTAAGIQWSDVVNMIQL
jgi:hypothetical protein